MPVLKASIALSVILGFAVTVGCRMCASPYDNTGPVISSDDCGRCRSSGRAGSAFAQAIQEQDQGVATVTGRATMKGQEEGENVGKTAAAGARVFQPRHLGRPLTREDIDPFVRLGIPPENILSVTDRPLEETIDENQHPASQSLASGAKKEPKPLPSEKGESGTTTAGWVRLGERTSATLR